MGTVLCEHGLVTVLLTCCLFSAQGLPEGGECSHEKDSEQSAIGTNVTDELRKAIDDLRDLIRVADDIQGSIKMATQKYSGLLQRAKIDMHHMKQAASKGGGFAS
jgi:hypothetical protein